MPISHRDRSRRTRTLALVVVAGLGAFSIASRAAAQTLPATWRFSATPYAWTAGLGGQVGINRLLTDVDLGFTDIVKHLRFGGMAAGDARKGRILLTADVVYISLSGNRALAIRDASGDVSFDQRETIAEAAVGYTPVATQLWSIDLLGGARYWNLSTDIGLNGANGNSHARSGTVDWVDATGGVRVRYNVASDFHLVAEADAGGGGSRSTWRTAGTATYDLSRRYGLMAGYKYLSVDYARSEFVFDTHTNGFVAGVGFAF